jgi:hypothetical protein
MKEEIQEPEYKFSTIGIERVNNGFVVEMDKRSCVATYPDAIYVFNTLEDLSNFIKELK